MGETNKGLLSVGRPRRHRDLRGRGVPPRRPPLPRSMRGSRRASAPRRRSARLASRPRWVDQGEATVAPRSCHPRRASGFFGEVPWRASSRSLGTARALARRFPAVLDPRSARAASPSRRRPPRDRGPRRPERRPTSTARRPPRRARGSTKLRAAAPDAASSGDGARPPPRLERPPTREAARDAPQLAPPRRLRAAASGDRASPRAIDAASSRVLRAAPQIAALDEPGRARVIAPLARGGSTASTASRRRRHLSSDDAAARGARMHRTRSARERCAVGPVGRSFMCGGASRSSARECRRGGAPHFPRHPLAGLRRRGDGDPGARFRTPRSRSRRGVGDQWTATRRRDEDRRPRRHAARCTAWRSSSRGRLRRRAASPRRGARRGQDGRAGRRPRAGGGDGSGARRLRDARPATARSAARAAHGGGAVAPGGGFGEAVHVTGRVAIGVAARSEFTPHARRHRLADPVLVTPRPARPRATPSAA